MILSKTTCCLCNKALKNEKLNPKAKTGTATSSASENRSTPIPSPATMSSNGATDVENQTEFQEFLRWKNLRARPKSYPRAPPKEER